MKNKKKKGFTLIELIVVIAILGILAALAVPRLAGFQDKARQASDRELGSIVAHSIATAIAAGDIKIAANGTINAYNDGAGSLTYAASAAGVVTFGNGYTTLDDVLQPLVGDKVFQFYKTAAAGSGAIISVTADSGDVDAATYVSATEHPNGVKYVE